MHDRCISVSLHLLVYLAYYNLEGKPLAKCLLTSCVFLMSTVPPSQRLGTALANAVGQLRSQRV